MQRTDVGNPNYYHRVVDCQWACPAHTNVPEYIRLIAQGRYTEAYMVNRHSNVFPGILGRTCDRPCEPACRRTRVDGKPVAICRLKRVAADNKEGDITALLPSIPVQKNGKKVALIGAGPASLTVANDLMPNGYHVTIFEKLPRPGGLMRINIPAFRLPETVLDEEIGYIVDMGVEMRYDTPVDSLKALVDSNEFDAVFVGSGAPKGKELNIPGRHDTDQIFIGIEWLESIHFGHVESVGKRVLIIGVGNTAMDCCRSAKRLGATDVKVIARKTRKYFKASAWELEDAEEEGIEILENLQPVRFIIQNGVLTGMEFDQFKSVEIDGKLQQEADRTHHDPLRCRGARDRAGERVPVDRARHGHRVRQVGDARRRQEDVHGDAAWRVLRRRRRVWSGQHHLGGRARTSGGDLDAQLLHGRPGDGPSAARWDPVEHEDGAARVGLQQQLRSVAAREDGACRYAAPLPEHDDRSGEGLLGGTDRRRGRALSQLRYPDALYRRAVHRVRRVHRHLPDGLSDDHAQRGGAAARAAPERAAHQSRSAALRVRSR